MADPVSGLAGSLSGAGGVLGGIADVGNMIGSFIPSSQTTSFSGGTNTQTTQTKFDDKAIQRMLDIMMQSNEGLASVTGQERQAGLFSSTTNQQLVSDLMTRVAGEVSRLTAPTETKAVAGPTKTKVKSKKDCFITTAVCEHLGQPDDCYDLETLRMFRDSYVADKYPMAIVEYYNNAPQITQGIKARDDAAQIWERFNEEYIRPAIAAIEENKNPAAYLIYRAMFVEAKTLAGV